MLALVGCVTAFVPLRLPFGATVDRVPLGPLCRTARLLCLAGPPPTRNSVAARAPPPVAKDEDEESSEEELKDELFDLLDTIPERGFEASEDDKADVLEIIAELEGMEGGDACADYSNSPLLSGTFTLLFCSSKTFHTNQVALRGCNPGPGPGPHPSPHTNQGLMACLRMSMCICIHTLHPGADGVQRGHGGRVHARAADEADA